MTRTGPNRASRPKAVGSEGQSLAPYRPLQVDLRPRDLRPRVVGFAGTLFPYSFHRAVSASIAGPSPRAFRVISYSTRGGTSANTVHEISVPALLIANVERLRISILQVGLLITAAIVILWFAKR
jgi:hypothetical protein